MRTPLTRLLTLLLLPASPARAASLSEDFSSYPKNVCIAEGASFGPWTSAFSGYGCVKVATDGSTSWLDESPAASVSPSETHASLVLGPSFSNPMAFSASVSTVAQLRKNSPPNPWEVAWILWHYTDNSHFYYFEVKPNGWELGKEDPAYPGAQRFLASGSSPVFPIGPWYDMKVVTDSQNAMSVYVNGQLITKFTDTERPYRSGKIALYNEDSHVRFTRVSASDGAAIPPTTPPAGTWKNLSFAPQTSPFEARFDAVPGMAKMDGVAGLSNGPASAFSSLAAIVRFNNAGTIDARNGSAYSAASAVHYSAGGLYRFRLAVNPSLHTYSAYVAPPGGAEALIGANYAFRTERAGVSSLNNLGYFADAGTLSVANLAVSPASTPTPPAAALSIRALSPPGLPAGGAAFNLTVDGSNFVPGAVVKWNGLSRPGVLQGTTRLIVYIGPADIAAPGPVRVTVANPNGEVSNALTFTIGPKTTAFVAPAASKG